MKTRRRRRGATGTVYTWLEAKIRISGDLHGFIVEADPYDARAVLLAAMDRRGSLTPRDGRDNIRSSMVDPNSIIVRGRADGERVRRATGPVYAIDGRRID